MSSPLHCTSPPPIPLYVISSSVIHLPCSVPRSPTSVQIYPDPSFFVSSFVFICIFSSPLFSPFFPCLHFPSIFFYIPSSLLLTDLSLYSSSFLILSSSFLPPSIPLPNPPSISPPPLYLSFLYSTPFQHVPPTLYSIPSHSPLHLPTPHSTYHRSNHPR